MNAASSFDGITHVIQLAIAPVFLLTAVGTFIGVLANRLARIVDRTRVLDDFKDRKGGAGTEAIEEELHTLGQRMRLIYLAIALEVFCGLFVGLAIATAFFDALLAANLATVIGGLFVLAMLAFISGLVVFLREIFMAVMRVRQKARHRSDKVFLPAADAADAGATRRR